MKSNQAKNEEGDKSTGKDKTYNFFLLVLNCSLLIPILETQVKSGYQYQIIVSQICVMSLAVSPNNIMFTN